MLGQVTGNPSHQLNPGMGSSFLHTVELRLNVQPPSQTHNNVNQTNNEMPSKLTMKCLTNQQ